MNINDIQMNPFTEIGSDWGLVCAGSKAASNMMTVSWGGVGVLWSKNVVFVFIRQSRYTKEFIDGGDTFSLAFLDSQYKSALALCGSQSGRNIDKWAAAGLTPAEKDGVVYPAQAKRAFLCRKIAAVPVNPDSFIDSSIAPEWYADSDFHTMYVGEIIDTLEK